MVAAWKRTLHLVPLLLLLPSVQALDDGFQTEGLAIMEGDHDVTWTVAGADQTEGQSILDAPWVRLRVVNVAYEETIVRRPVGDPLTTNARVLPEEVLEDHAVSGPLRLEGHLRLLPTATPLELRTQGTLLHLSNPGQARSETSPSPYGGLADLGGQSVRPREEPPYTHVSATAALTVPLESTRILLAAGDASTATATYDLPFMRLNTTRSQVDPITGSGLHVYDNHYLVIDVPRGNLAGDGLWDLQAHDLEGRLDGHATWFDVHGDVRDERDRAVDPTVLELLGTVDMDARLDGPRASWHVSGDATVLVDLEPLSDTALAASLGLVALVGSLLALLGRELASFLLGRWTPARVAADPLDSPTRRTILDAIHAHQPARLPELVAATGLARGTLRYHLRILEATHVLERDTSNGARQTTFALNGGSLRFRLESQGPTALAALGSARHPVRRTVLEALLAGARDQDDLLEALRLAGTPVARSTLSHHLARMVRAGLVESGQDGRRKTYAVAIDPAIARRRQYHNLLRKSGLLDPVNLLREGPRERQRFLDELRRAHPDVDPDRTLDRMQRLRLVQTARQTIRLAPTIHAALFHGDPA